MVGGWWLDAKLTSGVSTVEESGKWLLWRDMTVRQVRIPVSKMVVRWFGGQRQSLQVST